LTETRLKCQGIECLITHTALAGARRGRRWRPRNSKRPHAVPVIRSGPGVAGFFFWAGPCPCPRGLQKKKRNKKTIPKNNRPTFLLFFSFFSGAPCVGCGPSVDMPPHVGTRSWLWGLPLRASSL
jgi:hypothetical protein